MRISVVLPTHNRPALLKQAISSVKRQTTPVWELIIIDDGSVPPASRVEAVEGIGSVKWLRNEVSGGLSNARNLGLAAATGDIITFLDDDDLLTEDAMEVISKQFEDDLEMECLFINIVLYRGQASI